MISKSFSLNYWSSVNFLKISNNLFFYSQFWQFSEDFVEFAITLEFFWDDSKCFKNILEGFRRFSNRFQSFLEVPLTFWRFVMISVIYFRFWKFREDFDEFAIISRFFLNDSKSFLKILKDFGQFSNRFQSILKVLWTFWKGFNNICRL